MTVTKSDIEKTIYRIIMATWHTAKHKRTNARDVAILAADMIWHQIMDKSGEIKQALEYGANYRFGDGDITAMFEKALSQCINTINLPER